MVLPYIYFRDSTTIFPFCWSWYGGNSVTGVVYIRYTCAHGTHNGPFTRKKWIMFETVVDIDSFIPWLLLIKMIPKPDLEPCAKRGNNLSKSSSTDVVVGFMEWLCSPMIYGERRPKWVIRDNGRRYAIPSKFKNIMLNI